MNALLTAVSNWCREVATAWNRFWFTPEDPATLGLIRILAGSMLFYTHAVWGLGLNDFAGSKGWLDRQAVGLAHSQGYAWSFLWWLEGSPVLVWSVHLSGLVVFALLTLGLYSRTMAILAVVFTVSYANRFTGAQFGLDQINVMLAIYLAVGPCGGAYSLDRLLARRRGQAPDVPLATTGARVSTRLIQCHMCIIYLFAGLAKLEGMRWHEGTALWGAIANLEYQTMNLTWLANHLVVIAIATHLTIFWEVFYCALIWPRLSRPIMLLLAVPLHMGIGLGMGMLTFGLAMLYGNYAFVPPAWTRKVVDPVAARFCAAFNVWPSGTDIAAAIESPAPRRREIIRENRLSLGPAQR